MSMAVKTARADQAQATRHALIDAARDLFGANGYAATSLDEVVEAADVTKGALYHHFENKAGLFAAVYKSVKRDLARQVADAQMPPEPWDSLVAGARKWVEVHTDPAVVQIVLRDARAVLSSEAWHEVDRQWGTVIVRSALRRAINHGVLAPAPLAALATIVRGAYTEACMLVAESDDPDADREAALDIIVRLLSGLRAPSAATADG